MRKKRRNNSGKSVVVLNEKFPAARVPGAKSLDEVVRAWEQAGLEPVEVTERDFEQSIVIKHNAATGKFKWNTSSLDGLQALGLMFDVLVNMADYFLEKRLRPRLNSGKASVAVALEGNRVVLAAKPENDPVVIKGLLAAALLKVCRKTQEKNFNPLETFLGLFEFSLGKRR